MTTVFYYVPIDYNIILSYWFDTWQYNVCKNLDLKDKQLIKI